MYKSEQLEMQQALLMIDINSLQFVADVLIFGLHSRFPFCTNQTGIQWVFMEICSDVIVVGFSTKFRLFFGSDYSIQLH